ncbi:hypothetical protein P8452_56680 [Trifolium repens]|nr:hypothetical protein P8452_56680 [Trifolium repens]
MATLLNTVSPASILHPKSTRNGCSFLHTHFPNLHNNTFPFKKICFSRDLVSTHMTVPSKDSIFKLPDWKDGENDLR